MTTSRPPTEPAEPAGPAWRVAASPGTGRQAARPRVLCNVRLAILAVVLGALLDPARLAAAERPSAVSTPAPKGAFRIGVSHASFGNVNRNDATAALKAWAATVVRERHLPLDVQVEVMEQASDLKRALTDRTIEAGTLSAEEFVEIAPAVESVYVTVGTGGFTERYAMVVRRDSGIGALGSLKGKRLVRHISAKTSPALPWLETELAHQQAGGADQFFGEIAQQDSPSKAVLQVFFRNSDACLVTTNAFHLACELNPQLERQLSLAAVSPPLVPSLLLFRPDYDSPHRQEFESAILTLHTTTAGRQVLTVFQGTRIERQPVHCLDENRTLLEEYRRMRRPDTNLTVSPPPAPTLVTASGSP